MVLATGSVALPIPGVEFGDRVLDTWGAWSLPEQPKRIAVVGAGASGSEIASAYGRFGTEVMLIEMLDQILPAEDKDMARVVERAFKKQSIKISTGTPVENVEAGKSSVKFTYGDESAEVDYLCIAGGRAPDTEGARPRRRPGSSWRRTARSRSTSYQRTSNPKVYAIGDLVNGQGARPQGLRGGRRRGRARRRRRDPPGRPEPGRRRHLLPPAGRQRRPHRGRGQGGRATTSRSASSSSAGSAGRPSTTTKTASSSSSSTPSTARSSAPTSSATAPAT